MQALALQLERVANGGDPSIGGLEHLEPLCTTLAEADDLKLRIERA